MSSWFSDEALRLVETSSSLGASIPLASTQDQADAAEQRYLATIQRLEREVTDKNAQLESYAGRQLLIVSESKTLLQGA
uniref:Uncharacterized protein n=1 Tax=Peronospora matthiolae TaxID=2874970 RepID=A0AAV1TRV6_9STRA